MVLCLFARLISAHHSTAPTSLSLLSCSSNQHKELINLHRNLTLFLTLFRHHHLLPASLMSRNPQHSCLCQQFRTSLGHLSTSPSRFLLVRCDQRYREYRLITADASHQNLLQRQTPIRWLSRCHKLSCRLACYRSATGTWISLAAQDQWIDQPVSSRRDNQAHQDETANKSLM